MLVAGVWVFNNHNEGISRKRQLRELDWAVLRFLECQLKDPAKVSRRVQKTLTGA